MNNTFFLILILAAGALISPVSHSKNEERKVNKVFKGTAVFFVKHEKVDDFKREVLKIIGPTLNEAGNISYEAFQVVDDKGQLIPRFEFHELWKSRDAMMIDHKDNTAHMKNFFAAIRLNEKDSWIEKVEISGSDVEVIKER
jgi:quinol monooxygenase YgiN